MKKTIFFIFLLIIIGFHGNSQFAAAVKNPDSAGIDKFYSKIAAFSFILISSFTLDEIFRREATALQGDFGDKYFGFANHFGEAKMIALPPLMYGTSLLIKDERLKRTSCIAFNAFIVSGACTQVLKYGVGRARPYNNLGPFYFKPFQKGLNDDYFSFSSGHSATAWSLITPYAEEYGRWLYIIPVSVSLARVYKDRHWFSDVVMGAGLGYFSAWLMLNKPSKKLKIFGNGLVYYL